MLISLGHYDSSIQKAELDRFLSDIKTITKDKSVTLRGDKGHVNLTPLDPQVPLGVTDIQQRLQSIGFFPGGRIDGICGYRTRSSIRLFQEYVRSVENISCVPDGIVGPKTTAELTRWTDTNKVADWHSAQEQWENGSLLSMDSEYGRWLSYLNGVKAFYLSAPDAVQKMIKNSNLKSDTRTVKDWSFDENDIHLIGIRRGEQDENRKFDDVFVLLIKGLVFKFQGSTDPGHTSHPRGAPFLVRGQHNFRFGLHRQSYHALRPVNFASHGVLTVRSKGDFRLTENDLDNGLEVNGTINIHWGGKGVGRAVNRWSEGCQVITGSGYQNHLGRVVNCSDYVAINNGAVAKRSSNKTRGAYNVLSDLIVALSCDMREPGLVLYTLLQEDDLSIDATINTIIADSRADARQLMETIS